MLLILLLVQFYICNAQWTLQTMGTENLELNLLGSDQLGYPYNDISQWTGISHSPEIEFPIIACQMVLALLKAVGSSRYPLFGSDDLNDNIWLDETWVLEPLISGVDEQLILENETARFMQQPHYSFDMTPDEEKSISNFFKFGMSVVVKFLFEFYRIFRKLSSSQSVHQLEIVDVYSLSYDNAIQAMEAKKNSILLQISSVRRSADIFKSIIFKAVQIVQMTCKEWAPSWETIILYLADLISESINCPNLWYHTFMQILLLKSTSAIHASFALKTADMAIFKDLAHFENIFEFVMEKLVEYKEVGRIQLSAEALVFTVLADMEENGLLDYFYNR